ncbi:hypothetical protein VaNZ11_010110 [Volvox africanus]|uniref:Uncharacterized protein n=1 Tax=Volvox africanus TaxID=51714 RepID=A0ABQ5S909_9CHLO|nr:hypothetical protein VaNZ11_010110 [Volvox africanus]
MPFICQAKHHIPAVLLLWRAAAFALRNGTHTAFTIIPHRASEGKGASITTLNRWAHKRCFKQELILCRPQHGRLPMPYPREHHGVAPAYGGVPSRHAMSHWSALRSRLFPALRLAVLPVTAACLATFAGVKGHRQQPGFVDLHNLQLPAPEPFAAPRPELVDHTVIAPADVSTARQLLNSRGFMHPGMQPGVTWGAIPASSSGEVHAMFEYLLLFPA